MWTTEFEFESTVFRELRIVYGRVGLLVILVMLELTQLSEKARAAPGSGRVGTKTILTYGKLRPGTKHCHYCTSLL